MIKTGDVLTHKARYWGEPALIVVDAEKKSAVWTGSKFGRGWGLNGCTVGLDCGLVPCGLLLRAWLYVLGFVAEVMPSIE